MTYWRGNVGALRALGRVRGPKRGMTRIERDYGEALELRRQIKEIAWFGFEAIKLRLADNTFYEPDFFLMLASGELQCHEVKSRWGKNGDRGAGWEEDARVKIKVAAELYPFRFFGVSKLQSGAWELEEF